MPTIMKLVTSDKFLRAYYNTDKYGSLLATISCHYFYASFTDPSAARVHPVPEPSEEHGRKRQRSTTSQHKTARQVPH